MDVSHVGHLITRAKSGDSGAEAELFELVRAYIHRLATNLLPKMNHRLAGKLDPSDVAQSTVGEALARLAQFQGNAKQWLAYVVKIARNRVFDRLGKRDVHDEHEQHLDVADDEPSPDSNAARRETTARALHAVDHLRPDYRLVIEKRVLGGEKMKAVAEQISACEVDDLRRLWNVYLENNGLVPDDKQFEMLAKRMENCNEVVARQWLHRGLNELRGFLGEKE